MVSSYREEHPELFSEQKDTRGRITLIPLSDQAGEKHCGNCGDTLLSKRAKAYCGKDIDRECLECSTGFNLKCDRHASSREFCTAKCSNKSPIRVARVQASVLDRYGVSTVLKLDENKKKAVESSNTPAAQAKRKATNRERYGADFPAQNPELNAKYLEKQRQNNGGKLAFNTDKQKETMLERYGEDHPMKIQEFRDKVANTQRANNGGKLAFNTDKQKETMVERYGSPGRLGDPAELAKQKKLMLEKYGVEHQSQVPEIRARQMATTIERHGHLFNSGSRNSKVNLELGKRIADELGIIVEFEKQIEASFFDIYIPGTNLIIDINPTVSHNSTQAYHCLRAGCKSECTAHAPIRHDYHYSRASLARKAGFRLIQIFDWDTELIWSFIKNKLTKEVTKSTARKLDLRKISIKAANSFFAENHIQGGVRGQTICLGLFSGEKILAAASFGPARFGAKEEYEWLRYAVADNHVVYGAAGKLWKAFCNEAKPESVISYMDFNHTTQDSFMKNLEFEFVKDTGPALIWFNKKTKHRINQNSLLALGADRLLGTSFGSIADCGMNNEQIMLKEGFQKVFTAGNQVYRWRGNIDQNKGK